MLGRPSARLFAAVKPTILPAILKYEGSEMQHTQHQYRKDFAYIEETRLKKSKLDLDSVFRIADRTIMIREFLFEQPTSGVYVVPEGKDKVTPIAVWGRYATDQYLVETLPKDSLELEQISRGLKDDAIKKHEAKLRKRFIKFYESQGRIKRELDLNEELDLLSEMSNEEFEKFMKISSQ